ncbi:nucleotidyltransferase family protein [Sulfurospirillum arcachonense]|uniref:nucleotidyltransferase family protein n=1 Tax=Sulfurospirillum arcachonense TaxID=57666 RepID=UPI00046A1182|nr:nucleotidyltransferase family protein [Sulfurospirillum arcachonense]
MQKSKIIAVIILAAGSSSRMNGESKQLLEYQNKTLLENSVKKALEISENVFVVLGSSAQDCREVIKSYNVTIVHNKHYKEGIGSSIACGIDATKTFPHSLIMLCDQPFILNEHYSNLVKLSYENKQNIIASKYSNSKGFKVPAIFPQIYYKELAKLNSDKGAKEILNSNKCLYVNIDSSLCVDIDTPSDASKYL